MPRFEYTRTVYDYSFIPPANISRAEFESYKQMLNINPNAPLAKETGVRRKNNFTYIILVIGIICFLIGLMACLSAEKSADAPGWGILLLFGSLFLVLHPIINQGKLQSSLNEDKADRERSEFYEYLRQIILNSSSYDEFIIKYWQRYGHAR